MPEIAIVSGELLEIRTYGNWAFGRVRSADVIHTVVGQALAGLVVDQRSKERNQYRFTGSWKTHSKFGKQFEVAGISVHIEANYEALMKFLCRHYEGCGPRTADHIIEWYRSNGSMADLRDILIHQPETLAFQPCLAAKKKPLIYVDDSGSTMETQVYRRLAVQLGGRGLPDPVLRRMGAYLYGRVFGSAAAKTGVVQAAWDLLEQDCYRPILYVDGYGFTTAENVGAFFGVPKDAPERLAAIAHHVLDEASRGKGHVFLTRAEYQDAVAQIDLQANFDHALNYAAQRGLPVAVEDDRYYLRDLLAAERYVAERMVRMVRPNFAPIYAGNDALLEHAINVAEQHKADDFKLDPSQRAALKAMLTSRCLLHTLTAGPGSGKTAIMEIVVAVVRMVSVCFMAPTGKAAKVLHSRVQPYGRSASTIHRALEPQTDGFARNEDNPLDYRVIVVDEASMVDLPLMASLLKATPDDTHLVLIGDMDQLPSVGAGRVLEDAVLLPGDHNRLTHIHRNRGGILDLVRRVREGVLVDANAEDVFFMGDMGDAATGFDQYVLPAYLGAVERVGAANVSLILPRRKGKRDTPGWNVTYANARLQDCLNPETPSLAKRGQVYFDQPGRKVPDAAYLRIGDRIIVRKNLLIPERQEEGGRTVGRDLDDEDGAAVKYESVVNGDTGSIGAVHTRESGLLIALQLELDDGRSIRFPAEFLDYLSLAYAVTVHSAQGSEYREVVLVLNNGHADFLHRRIVYTAVSRARDRLSIFGAYWVMEKLVDRPGPDRNSALVMRVCGALTPAELADAATRRAAQVAALSALPPVAVATAPALAPAPEPAPSPAPARPSPGISLRQLTALASHDGLPAFDFDEDIPM